VELSHLLQSIVARAERRPLLTFVMLGTLLFAGRRALAVDDVELATLVVVVDEGATPAEVARATDNAILLSFAIRAGYVKRDIAVRDRLVRNVRFVDDALDDEEALEVAIRLDMHRSDPVARQRLIWLASEAIASATRAAPSDEALRAYLHENEERFRRAPTVAFEQIFVSRQRHGADFDARVKSVGERPVMTSSDPGLLPAQMTGSRARIDARFGTGFADRLLALDADGWSAPIPSAFGVHFVRILERRPGALPPLEQVRERVRHELERDSQESRLQGALGRMRAAYRIRIEGST
jgi:hypothetical protein